VKFGFEIPWGSTQIHANINGFSGHLITGVAYRYAVKIEHKFKHQKKWDFGSANTPQPKYGKDGPDNQPSENESKPQEKKGNGKMKNDTGKWCDFHKIPWHNTDECRSKMSLVVDIKDKDPEP
jgi:hypothetical protein